MDVRVLFLFGIILASVGVVTANTVVLEAQDYVIVQSIEFCRSETQGNITWPIMVRGIEVESPPGENYSAQIYTMNEGVAKFEPVLQVMPIHEVVVIIQTYPEPPEGELNVTPSYYDEEVIIVKNVTVGRIKPINTTLYVTKFEVPRTVKGEGNITGEYFVKFSVDNVTTCDIGSTYGLPKSIDIESFEKILSNIDVIAKSELDISKVWDVTVTP